MSVTTSPETEVPEDNFAATLDAIDHSEPEPAETPDAPADDPEPESREEPAPQPDRARPQPAPDWERQYHGLKGQFQQTQAERDAILRERDHWRQQTEQARKEAAQEQDDLYRNAIAATGDPAEKRSLQNEWQVIQARREAQEVKRQLEEQTEWNRRQWEYQQYQTQEQQARALRAGPPAMVNNFIEQVNEELQLTPAELKEVRDSLDDPNIRQAIQRIRTPQEAIVLLDTLGPMVERHMMALHRTRPENRQASVDFNRRERAADGRFAADPGGGAAGGAPRVDYSRFASTPDKEGNMDAMLAEINKAQGIATRGSRR